MRRKRTHTDGAALFATLPRRRHPGLLRLLVAYELIFDFLDNLHERHATAPNGRQLYGALRDALDPDTPMSAYYRHHCCNDDCGYLRALVEVCRHDCALLPAYERVRKLITTETTRSLVLGLNHETEPAARDVALMQWAERECHGYDEVSWFELAGAASATLTVYALLALAAEAPCSDREVAVVQAAYFPWVSATCTMLDSYVDQTEDRELGNHCYVDHYSSPQVAARRVGELITRSVSVTRALRDGHRHVVIAACMAAMYLSRDSALIPTMRLTTSQLVQAGGSLTVLLLPVLRLWRTAYALRSA